LNILVLNPGSNSLKAGIVACASGQQSASGGRILVELIVEGIGKQPKLSLYDGKKTARSEGIAAKDFKEACAAILKWLDDNGPRQEPGWRVDEVGCVGVRVVHGGPSLTEPAEITKEVAAEIEELSKWAPLHNKRSVEILPPLRARFADAPIMAVFDTAFHATIPEKAATYPIPLELSRKHQMRRYGFHGISHRYLMERYATIVGKRPEELKLVTMHLESGSSVTAIDQGKSVENTMGLTPLEGLMMGTRCGDIDAAIVPFLAQAEGIEIAEVMEILEKRSGLLGISGKSLDTRVLMPDYDKDERVHLALEMFAYRVRKAVGAYLAVLGGADAVIFGGGIAENSTLVRRRICEGLGWCGLEMDEAQNEAVIDVEGRLSTERSPIQGYVITAQETLQIAHECALALRPRAPAVEAQGAGG
jgi:acetate kinase